MKVEKMLKDLLRPIVRPIKTKYEELWSKPILDKAAGKLKAFDNLDAPYIIVAVPGCLCELELCLRHIPEQQNLLIVDNGLPAWEKSWFNDKHQEIPVLELGNKMIDHARVLDMILDNFGKPFGILDYDCFVFEPSLFDELPKIESDVMMNVLFCQKDNQLEIKTPATFIAFLNTDLINQIKQRFDVNSQSKYFFEISKEVKNQLKLIGVDEEHQLEQYKSYFDTLQLWNALGLSLGYEVNFIKELNTREADGIFHVGAGSSHTSLKRYWAKRGTYFWRRALETCPYSDLQEQYYRKYGPMKTADIHEQVPGLVEELGNVYFENVEKIVSGWEK